MSEQVTLPSTMLAELTGLVRAVRALRSARSEMWRARRTIVTTSNLAFLLATAGAAKAIAITTPRGSATRERRIDPLRLLRASGSPAWPARKAGSIAYACDHALAAWVVGRRLPAFSPGGGC